MNLDTTNEKAELPEDPTNERPGIPGFLKNLTEDREGRRKGGGQRLGLLARPSS